VTGLRIGPPTPAALPDISATRLKRAVLEGQVTVDGSPSTGAAVVAEGAAVAWDRNRQIRRHVDTSSRSSTRTTTRSRS